MAQSVSSSAGGSGVALGVGAGVAGLLSFGLAVILAYMCWIKKYRIRLVRASQSLELNAPAPRASHGDPFLITSTTVPLSAAAATSTVTIADPWTEDEVPKVEEPTKAMEEHELVDYEHI